MRLVILSFFRQDFSHFSFSLLLFFNLAKNSIGTQYKKRERVCQVSENLRKKWAILFWARFAEGFRSWIYLLFQVLQIFVRLLDIFFIQPSGRGFEQMVNVRMDENF